MLKTKISYALLSALILAGAVAPSVSTFAAESTPLNVGVKVETARAPMAAIAHVINYTELGTTVYMDISYTKSVSVWTDNPTTQVGNKLYHNYNVDGHFYSGNTDGTSSAAAE